MSSTLMDEAAIQAENNLKHTFFSWSKQTGIKRMHVDRAEGIYLYDKSGKRFIDFSSQLMNVNIGHGNQKVTDAVVEQMQKVSFVAPSIMTDIRGKLGKKLADIAPPNLNKTFFTLGGAEANENAIKLARLYTGRHKIMAQYRSYHGATVGAMSLSGDPRRHPVDSQQMPNVIHFENPYAYRCPWYSNSPEECAERCVKNLEQMIIYQNPDSIAAIFLEGESGTSGCIKYPPNYFKLVRQLADKYGILLISDEVMSGYGRTGEWFACTYHGVEPDMITMAKGLTAGYLPLGGMIVHDKIAAKYDEQALPLGLTYSAHSAACAAGLAVLNIYEEENLLENARNMSAYMDTKLAELMEKHPSVGDVRNTGLLGCLELVKDKKTKEPLSVWNGKDKSVPSKIAAKINELGMFTFVKWNFIFVAPPLCITKEQIDEGIAIIDQALDVADSLR